MAVAVDHLQKSLHANLIRGLTSMGIDAINPIQAKSFVPISLHRDVIIHAKCGSGKSLAYLLPLLNRRLYLADRGERVPPVLILQPTSILAEQTTAVISRVLHGDKSLKSQLLTANEPRVLWGETDVVVSTPSRYLEDLPRRANVSPSSLVLDEADHLLTGATAAEVQGILAQFPCQTVLAAATLSNVLTAKINRRWSTAFWARDDDWHNFYDRAVAKFVKAASGQAKILQLASEVLPQVLDALNGQKSGRILIFCETSARAKEVSKFLGERGWPVASSDAWTYPENLEICCVTDGVGRGVDWRGVRAVVNFHSPGDAQTFLHRSGRLEIARDERISGVGLVMTLMETTAEEKRMQEIQNKIGNAKLHGVFSHRRSFRTRYDK